MLNIKAPEVKFALDTARTAAKLVVQVQNEMVKSALTKDDKSPVTVADYGAQALVGYLLDKHLPNDLLVGEEDSTSLRDEKNRETLERITHFVGQYTDGATPNAVCQWIDRGSAESGTRYWTVDPIDGTKGFLRGDQYAVALALVENGQVQVGVLGCPNLNIQYLIGDDETAFKPGHGSIVVAVRGQGTWAASLESENFTRLSVSPRVDPIQARLLKSVEAAHTNTGKIGELVTLLDVQANPVGMDSQAKYAVLAAGRGDVLVRLISSKAPDYKEKVWDQGAGSIVIEEAGGRITDLHGKTLDFTVGRTLAHNRGVLATNGVLHEVFVAGLDKVGA
jgi:3'(2'), 5'-bisphosphate nucleotidase